MSRTLATRSYWVVRRGEGTLRRERVPAKPRRGHALVRAHCSGISAGTERLVGMGAVPREAAAAMACPGMAGSFALPIKYGYCLVGTVIAGRQPGRRVFTMHPHQGLAELPESLLWELPDALPDATATLLPNLETAWNAIWDAELTRDETAVVVGGGRLGTLVAHAFAAAHGERAVVVEADPGRRRRLARLPWIDRTATPRTAPRSAFDVAFHTSGDPAGLQLALELVGFEGRVVDLSWYGDRPVTLQLGGSFHWDRKRIVSSQVATVAASQRSRMDRRQRMAWVLQQLADAAGILAPLVGSPLAFDEMPTLMRALYAGEAPDPLPVIDYSQEPERAA